MTIAIQSCEAFKNEAENTGNSNISQEGSKWKKKPYFIQEEGKTFVNFKPW